jgi:hypothetical protein
MLDPGADRQEGNDEEAEIGECDSSQCAVKACTLEERRNDRTAAY